MKINNLEEFNKVKDKIPTLVVEDITSRINDWVLSGGDMEDSYVKKQFIYAERVLDIMNKKETLN